MLLDKCGWVKCRCYISSEEYQECIMSLKEWKVRALINFSETMIIWEVFMLATQLESKEGRLNPHCCFFLLLFFCNPKTITPSPTPQLKGNSI